MCQIDKGNSHEQRSAECMALAKLLATSPLSWSPEIGLRSGVRREWRLDRAKIVQQSGDRRLGSDKDLDLESRRVLAKPSWYSNWVSTSNSTVYIWVAKSESESDGLQRWSVRYRIRVLELICEIVKWNDKWNIKWNSNSKRSESVESDSEEC